MSDATRAPNVFVQTHDPAVLKYLYPEWPALGSKEKYRLLHGDTLSNPIPHTPVPPTVQESSETHNVVCTGMWYALLDGLDFEAADRDPFDSIGIGDDATAFNSGDESLNSSLGTSPITDIVTNPENGEIRASFYVGANEYAGNVLREIGVYSANGYLCNHAPLDPVIDKSNLPKTATVAVIFQFDFS